MMRSVLAHSADKLRACRGGWEVDPLEKYQSDAVGIIRWEEGLGQWQWEPEEETHGRALSALSLSA